MESLFTLRSRDWMLRIYANPKTVAARYQQLQATQAHHQQKGSHAGLQAGTDSNDAPVMRFSQPLSIIEADAGGSALELPDDRPLSCLTLPAPLLFENCFYEFEWEFLTEVAEGDDAPKLEHHLQRICESFRFKSRRGAQELLGGFNTSNEVGSLALPFSYLPRSASGKAARVQLTLWFEVYPVKLDMRRDLPLIHQVLDDAYPYWRFTLNSATSQQGGRSQHKAEPFPLLWLAHFEALHKELERGIRQIINAPHSRLQDKTEYLLAARMKRPPRPKQAEQIRQDLDNGIERRYRVTRKQLTTDTPENRFIKFVLERTGRMLQQLTQQGDRTFLSKAFFDRLKAWGKPLEQALAHPLMREIGPAAVLHRESLVLQQKSGYSAVYRIWQQLRFYLDALGNDAVAGVRSMDQLYELWCVIEVRRIILTLGFTEVNTPAFNFTRDGWDTQLAEGMKYCWEYLRAKDGVRVKLAHEPKFYNKNQPVHSLLVPQKPDILIEATTGSGDTFIWLFDAKYRVEHGQGKDPRDRVPDDAINQMHRYRDALLYQQQGDSIPSRPTFGAFALYPGFMSQQPGKINPYQKAIERIGIGAFALLPAEDHSGSCWLQTFLEQKLGKPGDEVNYPAISSGHFYLEEPSRIATLGMQQTRHHDLTLIIPTALENSRPASYFDAFRDGSARWYHTPAKTIAIRYDDQLMNEINYLAVATLAADGQTREVTRVWPVLTCQKLRREQLTEEQTGTQLAEGNVNPYWLLELGPSISLLHPLTQLDAASFRAAMRLTRLAELQGELTGFSTLPDYYEELLRSHPA
ncbi:TPA: restriction endonuclease-like protein [Aeromonas sobria]|nr:restriction endonuclease-like protein [Aeromonas sobria]